MEICNLFLLSIMDKNLLLFFSLVICLLSGSRIYAQSNIVQLSDSSKVSVLTNSASPRYVYSMFGHTVLRVQDPINRIDLSFNYGVFDFDSPNFMWRFVTGATDYMVVGYNSRFAIEEYRERGVEIKEQVLNLTLKEKQNVWNALVVNSLPENRIYRYNFLYDNCATRPRDIVEANIEGQIRYTATNKEQTYRNLIHECVAQKPWLRFGIDLVIGADADKIISDRQKDFLPSYLYQAIDGAEVIEGDSVRALVIESNTLSSPSTLVKEDNLPIDYPLIVGIISLLLVLLFSYWAYKYDHNILVKLFDTILFVFAGILGSIIYFLMFHSTHPCVDNNWNLVWLNPIMLIAGLLFFVKPLAKCIYYYHFINFVALTTLLLAWVLIPQYMELAFIPYVVILLVRSVMNVITQRKVVGVK